MPISPVEAAGTCLDGRERQQFESMCRHVDSRLRDTWKKKKGTDEPFVEFHGCEFSQWCGGRGFPETVLNEILTVYGKLGWEISISKKESETLFRFYVRAEDSIDLQQAIDMAGGASGKTK